jgi:hypothetical protein
MSAAYYPVRHSTSLFIVHNWVLINVSPDAKFYSIPILCTKEHLRYKVNELNNNV